MPLPKPSLTLGTFTPPTNPSPYLRTLLAYVAALNVWDLSSVIELFDDSVQVQVLPLSIGRPALDKRGYVQYFSGVIEIFKEFEATLHRVVESGNTVVVHASTRGTSTRGTPYANEVMLTLDMVPVVDGETATDSLPKITSFREFVDSATSVKWFAEERAKMLAAAEAR